MDLLSDVLFILAVALMLWAVNRDWAQAERLSNTNLGYLLALAEGGQFGEEEQKLQRRTVNIGTLGIVLLLLSVAAALASALGWVWAQLSVYW